MSRCASYGLDVMAFSLLLSVNASAATLARQCGAFGIVTYDLPPVAETQTTPISVPYAWLDAHVPGVAHESEAYEESAQATAANGRKVWECYVLGLDPQVATSDFRIASFPMKADGTPDWTNVAFDPPRGRWNVPDAPVVWKGAEQLEGPWRTVLADGGSPGTARPTMRFFKAVVFGNADDIMVQLWEGGPYWATKNVGASKPWERGYYFWWGDTVGYTRRGGTWNNWGGGESYYSGVTWVSSTGEQMSSSPFSSSSCPTYGKGISTLLSAGYIDATGNLVPEHDAAHVHWGGNWRMPTYAEFSALIDNCTATKITTNGVSGRLVTGKGSYANRSIFLPAAGFGGDSNFYGPGSRGYFWSSTLESYGSDCARDLGFHPDPENNQDVFYVPSSWRYFGNPVRPVRSFAE